MSFVVVWEIVVGLQSVGFDLSEQIVVGLQLVGFDLSEETVVGLQLVGFDLSEEIVVGLQLVGLALSGGISAGGCVNLFPTILKLLILYLFLVTRAIGQFQQLFSELLLVSFSATPLVAQSRH